MHHFKSFTLVKSILDEAMLFIKGNELKLTQVELLSFFSLKNVDSELRSIFYNHLLHLGSSENTIIELQILLE